MAPAGTVGTAPTARGLEPPRDLAEKIVPLERAFAFVDLCGFTRFIAEHGEHSAVDAIARFRSLVRELAVRRGVRVAKWLGDGAMIIGVEVGPTIATAAEVIGRYDARTLGLRGGVAHGKVLMIDGDDYIGRPTNLAARLCQAARPGELLAVGYSATTLPPWVTSSRHPPREPAGSRPGGRGAAPRARCRSRSSYAHPAHLRSRTGQPTPSRTLSWRDQVPLLRGRLRNPRLRRQRTSR